MRKIFDPLEAIYDRLESFYFKAGRMPNAIVLSPNTYRRLLEICLKELRYEEFIPGYAQVVLFQTPWGAIQIVIDELLGDMQVSVEE